MSQFLKLFIYDVKTKKFYSAGCCSSKTVYYTAMIFTSRFQRLHKRLRMPIFALFSMWRAILPTSCNKINGKFISLHRKIFCQYKMLTFILSGVFSKEINMYIVQRNQKVLIDEPNIQIFLTKWRVCNSLVCIHPFINNKITGTIPRGTQGL